jgi:cyclopropane-fatty-acyl-phospholipid synthase
MQSSLQLGSVFHNRIFPYNHQFKYKTLSILINLEELNNINKLFLFSINSFNLFSFFFKDHGERNENNNPKNFILQNIAKKFNDKKNYSVYLYCTPSFFGYVFNPISVYLCKDQRNKIKYICYEVKNTHHEQHCYFIKIKKKSKKIYSELKKKFYVSPFLQLNLKYKFYLLNNRNNFLLNINVYKKNQIILKTGISSKPAALNSISLLSNSIKNLFFAQKIMFLYIIKQLKFLLNKKLFFLNRKKIMIQSLFMDNLFKKYLEFKLKDIKWGEIKVNFKNSYEKIFKAKEGNLSSNIFIKDNSLFTDLLFRGELGFAESYINNKWETSNLTNLLKILLKNQQIKKKNWADNYFSKFIEKIKFILKSNSLNQAKKNIHYHYDLGNKFYSLWLDSSMTYSSGIFLKDNDNLLTSQNNKYDNIIKKLDIQSSDVILEVGSGWGGFIKRNYEITGSQIEGLTISEQQFSYVNELIKKNKLSNNSKIIFKDYRNLDSINYYDKIVSIEMFEAVGKKYWDIYFKTLNHVLKKNGKACFQIITINDDEYSNYINQVDFIQKYIFPGGVLPSKKILYKLFKENNFELYEEKSFGKDYAKTLRIWKENFNRSWNDISKNGFDEKFKNLWNYYLSYCETGFDTQHTDVSQFYLRKIN